MDGLGGEWSGGEGSRVERWCWRVEFLGWVSVRVLGGFLGWWWDGMGWGSEGVHGEVCGSGMWDGMVLGMSGLSTGFGVCRQRGLLVRRVYGSGDVWFGCVWQH